MANSDDEFEEQLRQEAAEKQRQEDVKTGKIKVDPDGTVYDWDEDKKAWFPRVDEDFIARYQMSYGTETASTTTSDNLTAQSNQASSTEIPPAPAVTDPGYADWYYKYYGSTDSSSPTPYDTNSKEYRDWYNYYYGQKDNDNKNNKETQQQKQSKESSNENNSENKGENSGDKSLQVDQNDYYSYYYQHYGQHEESEEKTKENTDSNDEKTKLNPAMAEYWNQYHSAQYSEEKMNTEETEKTEEKEETGKKGKKRKGATEPKPKEPPKWFDVEESKNTNVYVAGLPPDMTEEEFTEMMSKCGMIMYDPVTKKPKVKLYKNKDGNNKGDGLCCYIKSESVDLALQILDGSKVDSVEITVEKAKFQLKGAYDPKKKKKLTNSQKKKMKEKQTKLFDWRPDKPRGARGRHERVVIIKNFFNPKEFEENPALINEIRQDLREECQKFGDVGKIMVFDRHPDGIASINFKEPEEADVCIEALNRRFFAGRRLIAETWDGNSKYEIEETAEQEAKRLEQWEQFLDDDSTDSTANNVKKESANTSNKHDNNGLVPGGEGFGAASSTEGQKEDAGSTSS